MNIGVMMTETTTLAVIGMRVDILINMGDRVHRGHTGTLIEEYHIISTKLRIPELIGEIWRREKSEVVLRGSGMVELGRVMMS
jgi:hypothetical protein